MPVSCGHKTFLTGFWGVLPCQKGPKFQASTLNELVCQNWGAPLNFGKLLSTSTDTFQAYSPQWSGFPKLRGAPQFWETALQCTITDIASTTSKNDCFQMSFKLHDFRLPCFFCFFLSNLIANQSIDITIFDLKLQFWIFWHFFYHLVLLAVGAGRRKNLTILWQFYEKIGLLLLGLFEEDLGGTPPKRYNLRGFPKNYLNTC